MNKIAIALSAALSLGAIASANAADATVNFTGKIEALTCKFTIGGSSTLSVEMPTISAESINNGAPREKAFNLQLGDGATKCADGTYTFTFNGAHVNGDGRLSNTSTTDEATGVELAIDADGSPLDLRTGNVTKIISGGTGLTNIPMVARYEQESGATVTNGNFATAMEIFVSY
ncbi:TPA: fimbrial protein [Stenotrophomonas maltophilia]